MRDEAARDLGLRAADFEHLLRAGLLTHSETTFSSWHKGTVVRLYRQADLDRVTRSTRVDWNAARATEEGAPVPTRRAPDPHGVTTPTARRPTAGDLPGPVAA